MGKGYRRRKRGGLEWRLEPLQKTPGLFLSDEEFFGGVDSELDQQFPGEIMFYLLDGVEVDEILFVQ
jgi:hypothetical protein